MREAVLGLIFSGGTALAGLVLVFLGAIAAAFDSYEKVDKNAARPKYRARARLALGGFGSSLSAAALALGAHWGHPCGLLYSALVLLGLAFALVSWAAFQSVADIG
jgi:sulfite exporter TauE/SafE